MIWLMTTSTIKVVQDNCVIKCYWDNSKEQDNMTYYRNIGKCHKVYVVQNSINQLVIHIKKHSHFLGNTKFTPTYYLKTVN